MQFAWGAISGLCCNQAIHVSVTFAVNSKQHCSILASSYCQGAAGRSLVLLVPEGMQLWSTRLCPRGQRLPHTPHALTGNFMQWGLKAQTFGAAVAGRAAALGTRKEKGLYATASSLNLREVVLQQARLFGHLVFPTSAFPVLFTSAFPTRCPP